MRVILAVLVILLSTPALAWTPIPQPAACDKSQQMLEEMIDEKFTPVIISNLSVNDTDKILMIWMNPKNEILVTTTVSIKNVSISCIVAMGDKDTKMYLPKKSTD
jgi:hypothetical protein